MSTQVRLEQEVSQNNYVKRVAKEVIKGTSVYLLVIGILCSIIITLIFWGVSTITDDIQELKNNDANLENKISEVKEQIIVSNTYLEIIANNAINTNKDQPIPTENKIETNQ